jgi:hypothetical protein
MAGSVMAIGSHSRNRNLARLSEADAHRELADSKTTLEDMIERGIQALAYPFGWAGTYSKRTKRLAAGAGYRIAFASKEGVNRPRDTDAMAQRRVAVGYYDSPALFLARTSLSAVTTTLTCGGRW